MAIAVVSAFFLVVEFKAKTFLVGIYRLFYQVNRIVMSNTAKTALVEAVSLLSVADSIPRQNTTLCDHQIIFLSLVSRLLVWKLSKKN